MKSDPTFPKRVASIDIGTNTILLLISEVKRGKIHPLFEMETVVRLGEGVQKNKMLLKEAMERGLQTLAQYLKRCQAMEVQKIFAAGTSALREAKNSEDFLKGAKDKLNLSIEVISGEEEAQLSFLAVANDLKEVKKPVLVVDVGGGSTEFILGKGDQISHWISLPLGSVRFTEEFLCSDPIQEEEWEKMERKIQGHLVNIPHSKEPPSMVAVGGTATTLASVEMGLEEFIAEKIHHFILKKGELGKQLLRYRSKTIEERKKIPGLPVARADVILAGGTILYLAMEELKCSSVLISCHGVRYGLLYKKLNL
ncbi:MAG: Ppx/GppA family phosphatase [Deltaproteobacteria bacterium CG_4_8_14_3_um_filter_45_9]|nr:MAG: Ppx/GppA family phosphatase [Deltaproteobacteria bacterium CG03_land_8_20_14_0_80_45_14]PIX21252.1 MAG: Ppx/GppA family phosphatase [Deltaproteobacteria bacterium CG_4_8_14_3_um_filter_45_9]